MQVAVRLRQSEKLGRITVPPSVTLLRYTYDAQAKRARQERVGTVPFWADELPADVKAKLTRDEQADWHNFVINRNHQQTRALWRFCLSNSVRMLAYASKALQAGEKPASPTLARKAAKLFLLSLDQAGFGEGKTGRGRPRKDVAMDADFLLLRTDEERERWLEMEYQDQYQYQDEDNKLGELPQFAPKQRGFPVYPDGDLIARALRLAFVGEEGERGG